MQNLLDLYRIKQERDQELKTQIKAHILQMHMARPKPAYHWTTPFKALYYRMTATSEQTKIFHLAWEAIRPHDDKPS